MSQRWIHSIKNIKKKQKKKTTHNQCMIWTRDQQIVNQRINWLSYTVRYNIMYR